jgi:hypothetical protein
LVGIKGPGGTRHLGLRDRSATLAERLEAEKPVPTLFSAETGTYSSGLSVGQTFSSNTACADSVG